MVCILFSDVWLLLRDELDTKILISMGMSPEQGVSTGILISIGGIFGAAIIGLLASRMKIFYALSLFLSLTSACVFYLSQFHLK